uniref:Uncharacterized protein n=1 Tax=Tanacetum cinerariifolium TaxID=118510 RepID=A0A6L2K5Y1_TANCI|nr:hypothetical protein [Tanacetum cinerariifolium]
MLDQFQENQQYYFSNDTFRGRSLASCAKNQGKDMGNTDDQPNIEASPNHDWFNKPERPSTPDSDWNVGKSVDFRPPQT